MSADVEVTVTVPGDLAERLRGTKNTAAEDDLGAAAPGAYVPDRAYFLLAAAVKRTPRPFQVGDRVRVKGGAPTAVGSVVAVRNDWAWVEWNERTNPITYAADQLTHAEDAS